MTVDGILNVNKERGMTSHDVVQRVRRASGQRHTGHAGTLDPAAEGVLLVCLGKATRVVEYLMDSRKRYRAHVTFGAVSDTGDSEGSVVSRVPEVTLDRASIERALESFQGRILQVPPMFSALKRGGQSLYQLARKGIEVPREARPVDIFSIALVDWQPPVAVIDVACSRGTYIRTLAMDLGEALGCGAYLSGLIRTASGHFSVEDAVCLGDVEKAFRDGVGEDLLYPLDEALLDVPAVVVGDDSAKRLRDGQILTLDAMVGADASVGQLCRAYDRNGAILALLEYDADQQAWRPKKVFS
jgi:tRNA pseudouridine55 synthase